MLINWVYFTAFFDHNIKQNISFYSFGSGQSNLLQNSCSKSVLNELKHACESVLFLLKLQAIGLQLYRSAIKVFIIGLYKPSFL